MCVDGCTNVRLCNWCQLHDRFNTATHSTQHHMDHRLPTFPPSAPSDGRSLLSSELSGGVLFADSDRLVLLPPPLPSNALRHWRDFAVGDVVDVRDVYQKWSVKQLYTNTHIQSTHGRWFGLHGDSAGRCIICTSTDSV